MGAFFISFTAITILNVVLAARNVSKRRYGWATACGFSALWSMSFAVLNAARATGEAS